MIPHRIGYASLQSAKAHVPMQVPPEPLSSSSDAAFAMPIRERIVKISLTMLNIDTLLKVESALAERRIQRQFIFVTSKCNDHLPLIIKN